MRPFYNRWFCSFCYHGCRYVGDSRIEAMRCARQCLLAANQRSVSNRGDDA